MSDRRAHVYRVPVSEEARGADAVAVSPLNGRSGARALIILNETVLGRSGAFERVLDRRSRG
jgi:hypothetical protein